MFTSNFRNLSVLIISYSHSKSSTSVQYPPTVASDSCSWLIGLKPDVVFCYCSKFPSGFDMYCVLSCISVQHGWNEWLFEFLSARTSLTQVSCDLAHQQGVSVCRTAARWMCYWVFTPFQVLWMVDVVGQ